MIVISKDIETSCYLANTTLVSQFCAIKLSIFPNLAPY